LPALLALPPFSFLLGSLYKRYSRFLEESPADARQVDSEEKNAGELFSFCGPPDVAVQSFAADRFVRAQQLLENEYTAVPRACQQIYAAICGDKDARIALRGVRARRLDRSLFGTWSERKHKHGEESSSASRRCWPERSQRPLTSRPPCAPTLRRWEGWITVGEGRPTRRSARRRSRWRPPCSGCCPRDLVKKRSRAEPDPLEGEVRRSKKPSGPCHLPSLRAEGGEVGLALPRLHVDLEGRQRARHRIEPPSRLEGAGCLRREGGRGESDATAVLERR